MKFLKHCLVFVLIKSGVSYGQIVDIQSEVNKKVENGFSAVAMASWDRRTGSSDLSAATGSFLGRYRKIQTAPICQIAITYLMSES